MADSSVVKEWFRFANMDLKSAKYLMTMDENLTQFAVRARYPMQIFVDENQTLNAISQAEKIRTWAQCVLESNK